jgi:hypothetical protein
LYGYMKDLKTCHRMVETVEVMRFFSIPFASQLPDL